VSAAPPIQAAPLIHVVDDDESLRTSLLRLPREDFDAIILSHPQILMLVSELTDERRKQNAKLSVPTIAPMV